MSKFDAVYKKIEEQLPAAPQQQNTVLSTQPKPPTSSQAQQAPIDPKIMQELIAAKNEQQVQLALQKLQATQQQKPATGTTQPAV